METWNAYTADGQLTDHTLTRGEPISHGLYQPSRRVHHPPPRRQHPLHEARQRQALLP